MTTEELEQIRKIIREETVSKEEFKASEERIKNELKQAILDSQKDTINVLSELIHTGHTMHEEQIKRVEKHVGLPPLPPTS